MTTTYAPEPDGYAWLGRAATDIEEANSIEAYFRMRRKARRAAASAGLPLPPAGRGEQAVPGAVVQPDAGPPAGPGMPPVGGDGLPPDPRAPGSGESVPQDGEPRPVPLFSLRRIRRWLP